jgi:hypothetical protein
VDVSPRRFGLALASKEDVADIRRRLRKLKIAPIFWAKFMAKIIYLGVRGSAVAIDSATGQVIWSTPLKGAEFVNVVLDGNNLFATTRGEIFCLDPEGGGIRWHNSLKGYGLGLITIAGEGIPQNTTLGAEKIRRDQEQASAAATSTSTA